LCIVGRMWRAVCINARQRRCCVSGLHAGIILHCHSPLRPLVSGCCNEAASVGPLGAIYTALTSACGWLGVTPNTPTCSSPTCCNAAAGYEEAASQGLLAGLNAARRAQELDTVILPRDSSYMGTLMDDLVTKDLREPYRMLTSRCGGLVSSGFCCCLGRI
jgi:hypothetical protein